MPTSRRFAPQNWLLWQRPLSEVRQILAVGIVSSTVLKQQSALRSMHYCTHCRMRGATAPPTRASLLEFVRDTNFVIIIIIIIIITNASRLRFSDLTQYAWPTHFQFPSPQGNHSRDLTNLLNFYAPGNEVPVGQKK